MGEDYSNLQKMYQQKVQGQAPPNQQNMTLQSPKKPQGSAGCIIIIFAAGLFLAIGMAVLLILNPDILDSFTNKEDDGNTPGTKKESVRKDSKKRSIEGALTNAVIIPGEEDKNKLWLMSFEYKDSEYMNHTYIYDPYENRILNYSGIKTDAYPPPSKLFFINNEIWKIHSESGAIEPGITVYDPESGEEKSDTKMFTDKFPVLSSGISRLYVYENPPRIDIETKDGRKPYYDIANAVMYAGITEYRNSYKNKKNTISIFALGVVNSSESARKKLFLVTGPESSLWERRVEENYFSNISTLKFMTNSDARVLIEDKIFLEGVMLFQDDESCFVLYQNAAGANAERYLSCIDKSGNILWTVSTEKELFEKLRATDKDALSGMFFVRNYVHLSRSGNLVLFSYDKAGFIGLDYNTGKVLFEKEMK